MSLTLTEQRYAQNEKMCLAIVDAFNNFDQRLLGKMFLVKISNKSLYT